jgi:hypothetical protein
MEEEVNFDKELLLQQAVENIKGSGRYLEIDIVQDPIPPEVLSNIGEKYSDGEKILFDNFVDKVSDYIEEHPQYKPIINFQGEKVSIIDRMVILALAREMLENEMLRTYVEMMTDKRTEDEDDGDN